LSRLKNPDQILKLCVEIHRLENEADYVLRAAVAKLFKEEPDTRQLIKLKELYEILEGVTDHCEDVANVIEGIVSGVRINERVPALHRGHCVRRALL